MAIAKEKTRVKKSRVSREKEDATPAKKRRRSKERDIADEAPVKKKKSSKERAKEALVLGPVVDYNKEMNLIEKTYDLSSSQLAFDPKDRMSTNLLVMDILLTCGILGGGWYTILGKEQCGKSTWITQIITAALNTDVPLIGWFDYEGSSDPVYIESIMKSMGVRSSIDQIFGVQDANGKYIIQPRVRYYQPDDAETFFNAVAKLLRSLPQIKKVAGVQYYVFPKEQRFLPMVQGRYNKKLFHEHNMYFVPTERHVQMQALIMTDSYPAMLSDKMDTDDANEGMAEQARMFSRNIKKIKSKLKSRRVTILGVNQLRLKPMVMFGNPEYEPCGEALKLFSDCRISAAALAIPKWMNASAKSPIEEEPSITGKGTDQYRYVRWRAIKNKLGSPNLEGWGRIWISDNKGQGCGFDPVFDAFYYARVTGQVEGSRNKIMLKVDKIGDTKQMNWMQFKTLVLGNKEQKLRVLKELRYKGKPFDIRKIFKDQMSTGAGMDKFFAQKTIALKEAGKKVKKGKKDE
jgi:RecA/RadA recombinase